MHHCTVEVKDQEKYKIQPPPVQEDPQAVRIKYIIFFLLNTSIFFLLTIVNLITALFVILHYISVV